MYINLNIVEMNGELKKGKRKEEILCAIRIVRAVYAENIWQ